MQKAAEVTSYQHSRMRALRRWLRGLFGDSRGASFVEYMVIAGFVSLVAIGAFQKYGRTLRGGLREEAKHVRGEGLPGAADLLNEIGGLQDACAVAGVCPIGQKKCFAAGTPVATEFGDRPIESIEVGERVWARDVETGAVDLREVVQRFVTPSQPVIGLDLRSSLSGASPEHLLVTPGHRFWVDGRGWTHAEDLAAAPLLSLTDLVSADVTTTATEIATVYNLEVEGAHSYFVGHAHALVHNGNGGAGNGNGDCNTNSQEEFNKLKEALKNARQAEINRQLQGLPQDQRAAALAAIADIEAKLPPDQQDRAIALVLRAATDPKIKGFKDWQDFAHPRPDLGNLLNELDVALKKSASTGPGATITIGQDGQNGGKSFDIKVEENGNITNVEVKTAQTSYSYGSLSAQVGAAAEKTTNGAPGNKEAAIFLNEENFPPAPKQQKDGTVYVKPNGDQYKVLKDGTVIPQRGPINDLLNNLNGGGTVPTNADKLDAIAIYDGSGNLVTTLTKGPSGWTKSP